MSWSDPARRFEPAEDVQLRAELRDLLGLGAATAPQVAEPTPELKALADDLRREAQRRSRTERKRPTWGLLGLAALPLLAGLAGLGGWGYQQKVRADGLMAQTQRQEQELTRLAAAQAPEAAKGSPAKNEVQPQPQLASRKGGRKAEPYLVIPVEKSTKSPGDDYQRVKQAPTK